MDWSNWKIYIVLVILVAVVILILWHRCPTEDYHRLPGRPDSQKFLAPAPVLNPVNPSTFCSIPLNITTKWGCNFDTTIYNVKDVHFKLSYTGSDSNEIFINQNIADDTDGLTISNTGADFYYSYEYSLSGILPDYYTLNIESFVPNVPEATVRHCSTCAQDLTLLPFQYDPVPSIDVDNTTYYYGLEGSGMINVSWEDTNILYPLTNKQTFYNLSIEDNSGATIEGTSVILDYGQTSYQYDPNDVGVGSGLQTVIYVTQNPEADPDQRICTINSSKVPSSSFDIVSFSMPSISVNSGGDYCTTDSNFQIVWNVDCSSYVGPASCPGDFDYSVHISDSDSGFDLFFDQIYIGSDSICDQNHPIYCGTLSNTNDTYTFTINPMLPIGTYDMTVSMFLPNPGAGESSEEVSSTAPDPAVVKDPSTGSSQSARNVTADASLYALGNVVTCTWNAPTATGYDYTYQVSLVDSGDNVVGESVCPNLTETKYTYTLYDKDSSCGASGMNIVLIEGESYNVNVVTTSTLPGDWCGASVFTDSGVMSASSFEVVACVTNADCTLPAWDTSLLTTDSVRRGIYNLWCIYADDPSQCLIDVGQSFNSGLTDNDLVIDNKDIPNSVCTTVSGAKTCVRGTCPMLATQNGTGCIAPGQDVQQNWMRNSIPTARSGQFISDTLNQSYAKNIDSGTPFIPFIQAEAGGEQLTDSMDLVPIPGAVNSDWNIYLYPFYMKYFHPFLIWTFIHSGFSASAYTTNVQCDDGGTTADFYLPYHTGSSTYAQTEGCHSTTSDGGMSCYLSFGNARPDNAAVQGQGESNSNLTTFSTWGDDPPYTSTDYDVNSTKSKNSVYGGCGGIYHSSQFNTPADNSLTRQNSWYFGSDGGKHACQLYHKNEGNGMRMMVLTDIPGGNNKYWTGLTNTFGWNSSGTVNRIPGPPYSNNNRDPAITANSFCAPVQYGVLTVGKSSSTAPTQSDFYLEAYTWDSTYTKYNGLGFFTGSSITNLTNNALSFSTSWSGSDYYESGTHNQKLYLKGGSAYLSPSVLLSGGHQTSVVWPLSPTNLCVMDPSGSIRTQVGSTWLYLAIASDGSVFWIEPGYPGTSGYEDYTIPMWAMTWVTAKQVRESSN